MCIKQAQGALGYGGVKEGRIVLVGGEKGYGGVQEAFIILVTGEGSTHTHIFLGFTLINARRLHHTRDSRSNNIYMISYFTLQQLPATTQVVIPAS